MNKNWQTYYRDLRLYLYVFFFFQPLTQAESLRERWFKHWPQIHSTTVGNLNGCSRCVCVRVYVELPSGPEFGFLHSFQTGRQNKSLMTRVSGLIVSVGFVCCGQRLQWSPSSEQQQLSSIHHTNLRVCVRSIGYLFVTFSSAVTFLGAGRPVRTWAWS